MIEIRSEDRSRCLGHISIEVRGEPRSLQLSQEPNWVSTLRPSNDLRRRPLDLIEITRAFAGARIWCCASPKLLSQCRLFIPSAAYSTTAMGTIEGASEEARLRRRWPPEAE